MGKFIQKPFKQWKRVCSLLLNKIFCIWAGTLDVVQRKVYGSWTEDENNNISLPWHRYKSVG